MIFQRSQNNLGIHSRIKKLELSDKIIFEIKHSIPHLLSATRLTIKTKHKINKYAFSVQNRFISKSLSPRESKCGECFNISSVTDEQKLK